MARWNDKSANIWAAQVIPWLLAGIVGYVSWVVVKLVCVGYLLRPSKEERVQSRPGPAVAIITVYFVILLPALWSYFRIIYIIVTDPGYVPRSELWHQQRRRDQRDKGRHHRKKSRPGSGSQEKRPGHSWPDGDTELGNGSGGLGQAYSSTVPLDQRDMSIPPPGLEQFYTKDVFVCQDNGSPIWCTICLNWKPDRTHHCREVGRCVRKMDHFCPWAGGIISETSLKYFLQFVAYATIYWAFVLIVIAFFVAERMRQSGGVNAHCAGLFGLFAFGMTSGTTQLILLNTTTVENLTRKTKVWQLAILNPRPDTIGSSPSNTPKVAYHQVTYGLPRQTPSQDNPSIQSGHRSDAPENPRPTETSPPFRTFAILKTRPGENPWDLGKSKNFQSVMVLPAAMTEETVPSPWGMSWTGCEEKQEYRLQQAVKPPGYRGNRHITEVTKAQRRVSHRRCRTEDTASTVLTDLGIRAKGDEIDERGGQIPVSWMGESIGDDAFPS
ncbi:hypothetical protein FGG08_001290 [Glutinoglossum americanum]|uniref:Palmitoyltransferase n=1 Tax=Glutinoglossum americanum TaxID=1670608 RepID=A0A9P8IBP0_9PEZI|nr:hypothetical protein FGG08_001290 [Glutinoglossum americanum]